MLTKSVALCLSAAIVGTILASQASAQEKKDLTGVWILSAITEDKAGSKAEPWGPNPKGILILSENGYFSQHQMRSDRPKYAGKGRLDGTAEDDKRVARETLGYFGTYSVDDEGKAISFSYEASSWPNLGGTKAKRTFNLSGDALKTMNPAAAGGGPITLHWKRAK